MSIARCRDGSGIIHTFGSSFGAPAGSLVSVSDANTGLTQPIQVPLDNLLNTDPVWLDSYFPKDLAYGQLDTADSLTYNISAIWSGGQISNINYQTNTPGTSPQTIVTTVLYQNSDPGDLFPGDIYNLDKSMAGRSVPFSYDLITDDVIDYNGVLVLTDTFTRNEKGGTNSAHPRQGRIH